MASFSARLGELLWGLAPFPSVASKCSLPHFGTSLMPAYGPQNTSQSMHFHLFETFPPPHTRTLNFWWKLRIPSASFFILAHLFPYAPLFFSPLRTRPSWKDGPPIRDPFPPWISGILPLSPSFFSQYRGHCALFRSEGSVNRPSGKAPTAPMVTPTFFLTTLHDRYFSPSGKSSPSRFYASKLSQLPCLLTPYSILLFSSSSLFAHLFEDMFVFVPMPFRPFFP